MLIQVGYTEKHQITIRAGSAQLNLRVVLDHFLPVQKGQVPPEAVFSLYLLLTVGTYCVVAIGNYLLDKSCLEITRLAMVFFHVCRKSSRPVTLVTTLVAFQYFTLLTRSRAFYLAFVV